MKTSFIFVVALFFVLGFSITPLKQREVPFNSVFRGTSGLKQYSIERTISFEGAYWIRLKFKRDAQFSMLRITSLLDGAVQHLTPTTLAQWQFRSAFFNGDSVLVELFAENGKLQDSNIEIESLIIGDHEVTPIKPLFGEHKMFSLCGPDSRELSKFKRSARYFGSGGCTAWIINDKNNCFLSAHHCGMDSTGGGVIEFEVPLSTATPFGYQIVHPEPKHQYAVDPESFVRASQPVGIGNDWQYFGCFPNTETRLTPYQAQQDMYILATNFTVPQEGSTTQIIGYGVVEFDKPKEWNQVQKHSVGTFAYDQEGTGTWMIFYTVDTTGGDSGSAVENNGVAIGVHTHGGCSRLGGGENLGTFIGLPSLQEGLKNPRGVCSQ